MIMNLNENMQLETHQLLTLHYIHIHVLVLHYLHIHSLYGLVEILEKYKKI